LSYLLRLRYEEAGNFDDIDRAVVLGKRAVDHSPKVIDTWLTYTAALGFRYLAQGRLDDLETAIQWSQKLRQQAKEHGDTDLEMHATNNLSRFFALRFERLGALDDITEGIQLAKEAVNAAGDAYTAAQRLNNLSILWARRYERTTVEADREEAIKCSQQSLEKAPDHPQHHQHLNSLGCWLSWRYDADRKKNTKDLDTAILRTQEAVDCVAPKSPEWRVYLGNLCKLFYWKYVRDKDDTTLNEAIRRGEQAIADLPLDRPLRVRILWNLGEALIERHQNAKMEDDFGRGIKLLTEIKDSDAFSPAYRLNVIMEAIRILEKRNDFAMAMSFAKKGVELLPKASIRSLRQTDQQEILRRYAGLASEAAALAIQTHHSPSDALILLEEGLGVIAAQQYNMRSDLTELQEKHPEEASRFRSLLSQLEQRSEVSALLDALIDCIRTYEGFEQFLQPPTHDDCCGISRLSGQTIVVVNVAFRCDALIVCNDSVSLKELSDLSSSSIVRLAKRWIRANENGRFEILETLWKTICSPILSQLGHTVPYNADEIDESIPWPNICWICTGPSIALPIHAAGYHNDKSGRSVLDRTISSYSVSIKAMLYAANNLNRETKVATPQPDTRKALLVAMPTTPGMNPLNNALPEIDAITRLLTQSQPSLSTDAFTTPNKQSILTELSNSQIFHFAGHGIVDAVDASQSSLVLADGHLTVSALQSLRLHLDPPQLAYLSACNTGVNPSSQLVDEGIHLMGACQIAGFQNVIGTLWKVSDAFSVNIAREVYKGVLEYGYSWQKSLHMAVRKGRSGQLASGIDAEKTVKTRDGSPSCETPRVNTAKDPLLWAAYFHMG
ncbi:hypothetical protein ASPBRDRAFT_84245, partial [Aspergillus brasiliensis CBS 101740]